MKPNDICVVCSERRDAPCTQVVCRATYHGVVSEKWYRAEVLSISEFREYRARSVEAAADMAAEEFGEDDIGRVTEKR